VGFEAFTAVTMKNAAFRDVVSCGLSIYRRVASISRVEEITLARESVRPLLSFVAFR
jgi:hypothetical protein